MQEAKILPRNLKGNLQSFPLLERHFIPKLLRDEDVVVGRLAVLEIEVVEVVILLELVMVVVVNVVVVSVAITSLL